MTNLHAVNLDSINRPGGIVIHYTPADWPYIFAVRPQVTYKGPGRDTFTYMAIRQLQRGQLVTVYATGVAGVHVGPAPAPAVFDLVGASQPQPDAACPQQSLCAMPWPGVAVNPISGAPPVVGSASLYLEVYQRKFPEDADGFSSPSFNNRKWVAQKIYGNLVTFI